MLYVSILAGPCADQVQPVFASGDATVVRATIDAMLAQLEESSPSVATVALETDGRAPVAEGVRA